MRKCKNNHPCNITPESSSNCPEIANETRLTDIFLEQRLIKYDKVS